MRKVYIVKNNKTMKSVKNKTAIITGAGSGIGQALAIQLAEAGCQLVINDYHQDRLDETVKMVEAKGGKVLLAKAFDVAKENTIEGLATEVDALGGADIIINNAGVALGGFTVETISMEDFHWLMDINFYAVVRGTKSFLPQLKKKSESCVVNISSVFGLGGIVQQSAYCSSKFAVRGFTESLKMEAMLEFPHVNIMCVHPGGIKTNIARDSKKNTKDFSLEENKANTEKYEKAFITTPEKAAETIINGILKNKQRVLIGKDARQFNWITRLFPVRYTKMLINQFKREDLI